MIHQHLLYMFSLFLSVFLLEMAFCKGFVEDLDES